MTGGPFRAFFNDRLLRNIGIKSLIALVLRAGGYLSGFLFTWLVSRYYGSTGVGYYSLVLSIFGILTMIGGLGFHSSVLRFVGQLKGQKQKHKIRALHRDVTLIVFLFTTFLSLILFFAAGWMAGNIFDREDLATGLRIIAGILPFAVVGKVNIETIRGIGNIKLSEYFRNINTPVINIVVLLLSVLWINNHIAPVYSFTVAQLITFVLTTAVVWKMLSKYPARVENPVTRRELIDTSIPMVMSTLAFVVLGYLDTLMLGSLGTVEDVGVYNVALKIALSTTFMLNAFNKIVEPKFAEFYFGGQRDNLEKVVHFVSKSIFLFSAPLLLLFLLFPEFFMGLFGEEFKRGALALMLLTIARFVAASSGSVGVLLNMTGHQKLFRNVMFLIVFLNIVLNYLLIPRYGLNGAAIATMSVIIMRNLLFVFYVRKKLGITSYYFPFVSELVWRSGK